MEEEKELKKKVFSRLSLFYFRPFPIRWVYGTFYHDFMPYHRPDLMWSCLPIRTDLISSGIFFQAIPWHDLECVFITVYVSSVSYLKCLLRARLKPVCPTLQVQTQCLRSGYAVNIATDLKSLCESSVIPLLFTFVVLIIVYSNLGIITSRDPFTTHKTNRVVSQSVYWS